MRKIKNPVMFMWILVITMLGGCTANIPLTHYYTFYPAVEAKASAAPKSQILLAVDPFEADIPYQQGKLVFRTSPYEVNFYDYHKWLRPLEELVTEQVLTLASSAGMFQHVQASTFEQAADYILQGRIKMFDQWYPATTSFVQVSIEYRLISPKNDQVIWIMRITTTADISELTVVETVKGFEKALQDNILQALGAIDGVFSQQTL